VWIKGQHHSGNSGSGPFLDAVQPRLVIATSRDFPDYERIDDKWAEDVQARGIKLFRQDETGAVTLRFADTGWEAQSYLTRETFRDRKSTRLNSSHLVISYAVFCLKKKI